MTRDLPFWVAFVRIGFGYSRFTLLLERCGSMEAAWRATGAQLRAAGLDDAAVTRAVERRPEVDPDAELAKVQALGATATTWQDEEYPALLKETSDPPPVLFCRGRFKPDDARCIAVVGTRGPTHYGSEAARVLSADIARCGLTIVSGLARGIDAVAHTAALEAGGRTIAVMGSGLDVVYPPEHRKLAEEIAERGVLMSEQPLGTRPNPRFFPRRNRVLSGLSLGVVLVEAGEQSGALHTARHALEQGREVFAVPGSIFSPASIGTNRLIQEGAKLVLDFRDVLDEVQPGAREPVPVQLSFATDATSGGPPPESQGRAGIIRPGDALSSPASDPEMDEGAGDAPLPPLPDIPLSSGTAQVSGADAAIRVLARLGAEPVYIDEVCRLTDLPVAAVSAALTLLELQGLVRQVGAMHYVRIREGPSQHAH